ncbi:hypothetical protein MON38_07330 [Hymenobacter sp. DH14]|uniref:Uncharacterized protein n=1 Tax=Hymenobacter cyanobacteriorum TaxID=2926463 RepID=A0A9X1VDM2_9BACT|nr:hypothetical protein [Hymenobacter cyanobacteriorum]MCI1187229.1 hypothetical protein [Hymenobacter cyanobacteriorum]
MTKVYSFILLGILAFGLNSCVLNSKFSQSSNYQEAQKVSDLHLVVIGDKDTKEAMNYVSQFLADSLIKNKINTSKAYNCCRDKDTDMNAFILNMLPTDHKPDNVLTVAVSKVVVGYGTTSSREFQLDLFNTASQSHTWNGRVLVNMSWFVSDQNYRDFAKTLTKAIMIELRKKRIV